MRNINELIGVIKGINFDGIINDREIAHLRIWADKNRNLAYEPHQVELIRLIDEVLEDNIITDDERERLLQYSDNILRDNVDDTAKILELNGIVEGIVCDGEVNEQEVYRLKAWMDEYGEYVKGHKASYALCKIVNDILDDEVVTEDEQKQLLQLLSARISNSQFETKLEYLRKLVKSRNIIGIELIDILDDEKSIDEIHKLSETQLKMALNSYTGSTVRDPEIVFISLVLIAMLTYDGNYYNNVRLTYLELYSRYSEQRIEGLIRTIINRYRLDEELGISGSRIINLVLSNAIVPCHFLAAYFEFIYDIYKLNFEYNLTGDLYEEFQFVFEGLRSSLQTDNDELQLHVTRKTYKLIKSTKLLIVNENNLEPIIKLSIIIAKLIDKRIWNKELNMFNPYLKAGYEEWCRTLRDDISSESKRNSSTEARSRWEPKYQLDGNAIYIVPPVHKIKSEYDYSDVRVVVVNGNDEVFSKEKPDIREIVGGYQISISKIKIDKIFGKVAYKLLVGQELIYDSKEKLYRRILVFDPNGNEIKNNSDYSETAIFCYKNCKDNFKPFFISDNYMLASQRVKQGDTYIFEDISFNFSSLTKPGIFGEEYENHLIVDALSQEKMLVYRKVGFLVFESDSALASYQIVDNGDIHRLDEYKYIVTEREGSIKYTISLESNLPGIHLINVYRLLDGKREKILSSNFVLDPTLEANAIKIDDEKYILNIRTGLCTFIISKEINIRDCPENGIEIKYNKRVYRYCIPFEFDIYRISGLQWRTLDKMLWIGDISHNSMLDIYGDRVDELKVSACTGEVLNEEIKLKNKGVIMQVPIGFITSYKTSYNYTILHLIKDGISRKTIFCYNRCVLNENETEIFFEPVAKRLTITPYYNGEGNVFISIFNSGGSQVVKSEQVRNGESISLSGLKSFEKYSICFYEKETGISVKGDRLLKQYESVFYAWDDLIGRTFKISKVYFDQNMRGDLVRKSHFFNRSYLTFTDKEDDDMYIGELFTKTSKGNYMLTAINPASIKICSDVVDSAIELSITKEGDGLFLDFEHHAIKNTLDDKAATDIFSYIIDMNGVETDE